MTLEEEVALLRAENVRLRGELAAALEIIEKLRGELAPALAQLAEVREKAQRTRPAFVRANTKPAPAAKEPRKKRTAVHNKGRRREEQPARIVQHALEQCPACGYALRGQSIDWTRQVLELPLPPPMEVVEHQYLKRHCPACDRWHTPKADADGVVGQGRLGLRLLSLLAYLRTVARLPLRGVQEQLETVHGLHLSVGGIQAALTRLQRALAPVLEEIKTQARASPSAHMDETQWREGGQNGYVWTLCTTGPTAVRYYEYDKSRAGAVARRLLGAYRGILVTDFYAAYGQLTNKHQYCWVHLLRDLHALKEAHPADWRMVGWARAVRHLYEIARAEVAQTPALAQRQRELLARLLDARLQRLGSRYARRKGHPCRALAQRLLRHQGQFFAFVRTPEVSADNNPAERALRPLVIMRKISGGSRSAQGSATRLALASAFGTWQARHLNPLAACIAALS
jgi:transposase